VGSVTSSRSSVLFTVFHRHHRRLSRLLLKFRSSDVCFSRKGGGSERGSRSIAYTIWGRAQSFRKHMISSPRVAGFRPPPPVAPCVSECGNESSEVRRGVSNATDRRSAIKIACAPTEQKSESSVFFFLLILLLALLGLLLLAGKDRLLVGGCGGAPSLSARVDHMHALLANKQTRPSSLLPRLSSKLQILLLLTRTNTMCALSARSLSLSLSHSHSLSLTRSLALSRQKKTQNPSKTNPHPLAPPLDIYVHNPDKPPRSPHRKYSGAGFLAGTPRWSCGAASKILKLCSQRCFRFDKGKKGGGGRVGW
jgi:hypothetical protein